MAGPPDLILDLTTTANHRGRMTGIARVEFALAKALALINPTIDGIVWSNRGRRFVRVPLALLDHPILNDVLAVADRQLLPEMPYTAPLAALQANAQGWLLVAGSAWMQNNAYAESVVAFCNTSGRRLALLVHDLIPVLFPYYYSDAYVQKFTESLDLLLARADLVLTNSVNTERDYLEHCRRRLIDVRDHRTVRLGDELDTTIQTVFARPAPIDTRPAPPARPFVLAVGAVHRRKNYELLHTVWHLLLDALGGATPHLVIVGGATEDGRATARMLTEDRRIGSYVHLLDHVDDALLEELYDNCLLTVYPSHYEGWGLPVCESLRRGKICLASAIASVREIFDAGDDFLPPTDPTAWRNRLVHYVRSAAARRQREAEIKQRFQPTSWVQTAEAVCTGIASVDGAVRVAPPVYRPGSVVVFNRVDAALGLRGGWEPAERWGRWSRGRAGLAFVLRDPSLQHGAVLELHARVLRVPDAGRVSVWLNGVLLGAVWPGSSLSRLVLPVPAGGLALGENVLEFANDAVQLAAEAQGLHRTFAFGMQSLRLVEHRAWLDETWLAEQSHAVHYMLNGASPSAAIVRGRVASGGAITAVDGALHLDLAISARPSGHRKLRCYVEFPSSAKAPRRLLLTVNGELSDAIVARQRHLVVEMAMPAEALSSYPLRIGLAAREEGRVEAVPFALRGLVLARDDWHLDRGERQARPGLATDQCFRFGADLPGVDGLTRCGWDEETRFGIEMAGDDAFLWILRDIDAPPLHSLKMNLKQRGGVAGRSLTVEVMMDGEPIGRLEQLGSEVEPRVLSLPRPVMASSRPLELHFRRVVQGELPAEAEPRLVLRALELLDMIEATRQSLAA